MTNREEVSEGGTEFAARVRVLSDETGSDMLAVVEALRWHGMDDAAAREELSRPGGGADTLPGARRRQPPDAFGSPPRHYVSCPRSAT